MNDHKEKKGIIMDRRGFLLSAGIASAASVLVPWDMVGHILQKEEMGKAYASEAREVDKPTYEIAGPVEKYDQRDHANARSALASLPQDDPRFKDYYSRHPEYLKVDSERKKIAAAATKEQMAVDPVNKIMSRSTINGRRWLGKSEFVDGPVAGKRYDVDPELMTRKVKEFGKYMGAADVRITELNQNWVYSVYANPYTPEPYGSPVELNYKYVICMSFVERQEYLQDCWGYGAQMETGWAYSIGSLPPNIMAKWLRDLGWPARGMPPENSPYIVPPTYIDAGMGEQGRCQFCVNKDYGAKFRPGAVATDIPLLPDKPVDFGLQDFCDKCLLCAEVCPSGAISKETIANGGKKIIRGAKRWWIDAEKCRDYWDQIGGSCAACQAVCPYNHPSTWIHDFSRDMAQQSGAVRSLLPRLEKMFYGESPKSTPVWIQENPFKK